MNGILLEDKPEGWTSHDVVAKVRSVLRQSGINVKVGHAGTLDPLATGLMIILIGAYTKKAAEYSKLDKTYEAVIKLGQTSTTGDEEGEKTEFRSARGGPKPEFRRVVEVLKSFVGEIEQVPHVYSAVKIGGKRAYKLARAGQEVKMEPRPVTIYSIKLTDYSYPRVNFTTKVSSGTYIRSLAEDIGQKLATGAYLASLKRTQIGKFDLKNGLETKDLSLEKIQNRLEVV